MFGKITKNEGFAIVPSSVTFASFWIFYDAVVVFNKIGCVYFLVCVEK